MKYKSVAKKAEAEHKKAKKERAMQVLRSRLNEIDRSRKVLDTLERQYKRLLEEEV
jgi:hypothetical protein